jgi:hypothetical protein
VDVALRRAYVLKVVGMSTPAPFASANAGRASFAFMRLQAGVVCVGVTCWGRPVMRCERPLASPILSVDRGAFRELALHCARAGCA